MDIKYFRVLFERSSDIQTDLDTQMLRQGKAVFDYVIISLLLHLNYFQKQKWFGSC